MIKFESWIFYEFVLDDNIGVLRVWAENLNKDARAEFDLKLLRYRRIQNRALWKEGEFRPLGEIDNLPLKTGNQNWRLIVAYLSVNEMIVLAIVEEERDGRLAPWVTEIAQQRLDEVRSNSERYREYRFD